VTPRFAATVSMLFTELPLAARVAAATEAGFEGVELWWPGEPVPRGFEVVLMNFGGGDVAAGEPGRSAARG
jgi:hydroxypyruvate isomerase